MDGPALGMNLTPLKLTNGNASFYWETYTALGLSLNLELIILSKLTDQQISWSSLPLPSRLWGWGVKAPCRQRVVFLLHCFTPPMPSMLPESKGYSTNISGWLPLQVCLKTCWGIAHGAMVMTRAQNPLASLRSSGNESRLWYHRVYGENYLKSINSSKRGQCTDQLTATLLSWLKVKPAIIPTMGKRGLWSPTLDEWRLVRNRKSLSAGFLCPWLHAYADMINI